MILAFSKDKMEVEEGKENMESIVASVKVKEKK